MFEIQIFPIRISTIAKLKYTSYFFIFLKIEYNIQILMEYCDQYYHMEADWMFAVPCSMHLLPVDNERKSLNGHETYPVSRQMSINVYIRYQRQLVMWLQQGRICILGKIEFFY